MGLVHLTIPDCRQPGAATTADIISAHRLSLAALTGYRQYSQSPLQLTLNATSTGISIQSAPLHSNGDSSHENFPHIFTRNNRLTTA